MRHISHSFPAWGMIKNTMDKWLGNSICEVTAMEKKKAIMQVIDTCTVFSSLPDMDRFKRAVLRRERIETTSIGHGVAIAHGKILGIDRVYVGLGVSREGIVYDSLDGMPVHLLFVIASSPITQIVYLHVLGKLLETARRPDMRRRLDHFDPDSFPLFLDGLVRKDFLWLCDGPFTVQTRPRLRHV